MAGMIVDPPELTDGVVRLRAQRDTDLDDVVAMASDPEFARWTSAPSPFHADHARTNLATNRADHEQGRAMHWVIDAPDGFAGKIDVRYPDDAPPTLGFGLAPTARGKGYASRAVRLAARWAFEQARLPVLHWSAEAGNLPSWRVAHACGFTFHGEIPLALPHRGTLVDGWFASLAPDDDATTPCTTWFPVPVLDGERIRLRPLTEDDVPRIVEACSDPVTQHWLAHLPAPYTAADAHAHLRRSALDASLGRAVTWAVADRTADRLLASINVHAMSSPLDPTGGEVGYWTHPAERGRGVLREAVELLVAHAFRPLDEGGLGRHRLAIGAAVDNTASRAVAERAGFTLWGTARQDGRTREHRLDDGAWYELLRSDTDIDTDDNAAAARAPH